MTGDSEEFELFDELMADFDNEIAHVQPKRERKKIKQIKNAMGNFSETLEDKLGGPVKSAAAHVVAGGGTGAGIGALFGPLAPLAMPIGGAVGSAFGLYTWYRMKKYRGDETEYEDDGSYMSD